MADFSRVEKNLKTRGYTVTVCETKEEAAAYLNGAIDGVSVAFGGSRTLKDMGLYDMLKAHNKVIWHWEDGPGALPEAMQTDVYVSSVNAMAETGESVNIDGNGNRVSATLFGHKKVYLVVGANKLTETLEDAVWRARNVAGPIRAQQMGKKTPCALKADRCYDCRSPERICRGMVVLMGPMMNAETEVILVHEELGC
ncbi:MAG: lactate utilization protein [Ruminococcaceae bacterium]|nr:lactate utilization protein [Oscillospiraceae bacterium]